MFSYLQAIANTATQTPTPTKNSYEPGLLKKNKNNGGGEVASLGAVNQSALRKIPENLKLNSVVESPPMQITKGASGPYIAIADCISGSPLINRDNPTTPLNSLDSPKCPKFWTQHEDTPRSHIMSLNIGLNVATEQPYSPKRNNIQTVQIIQFD